MHVNSVNGKVAEFTEDQATKLQRKFNEKVKIIAKAHIDMTQRDQCMDKLKPLSTKCG